MTTVLVFVLWMAGGGGVTSFSQEFETAAACHDARDGLVENLSKDKRLTFTIDCYPKGEVKL